jgi:hypothetical protein
LAVSNDDININFTYHEDERTFALEEKDSILVYGTTLFFKTIRNVIDSLKGFIPNKFTGKIYFNFFGIDLIYDNTEIFYLQKDETKIKIDLFFCEDEYYKLPRIKYSFNKKDFPKYRAELIYFATETKIYPLDSFKGYEEYQYILTHLGRFGLPDYIVDVIHP